MEGTIIIADDDVSIRTVLTQAVSRAGCRVKSTGAISTLMIIGLAFLNSFLGNFSIVLQILIVFFNLIVFFVSKREIEKDLINSKKNLYEIKDITQ